MKIGVKWIVSRVIFAGFCVSAMVTSPARAAEKSLNETNPEFSWMVATSPIGLLAERYNLQFGHFLKPGMLLSVKGTYIDRATQNLFGKDDGYEVGLRASWYQAETTVGITGQLGAFYAKYRRGDFLSDALDYIFDTSNITREEVNGPVFEGLTGVFLRSNQLLFELLGGIQFYPVAKYRYDTSTGSQETLRSASWDTYLVLEANVGMVF